MDDERFDLEDLRGAREMLAVLAGVLYSRLTRAANMDSTSVDQVCGLEFRSSRLSYFGEGPMIDGWRFDAPDWSYERPSQSNGIVLRGSRRACLRDLTLLKMVDRPWPATL